MSVPTVITDCNTTLASNSPAGTDVIGTNLDDYLRAGFGFIAQLLSATQAKTYTSFTTGGTSTAFTLTPSPAISALATNQEFDVTFNAAAGATPTLAISGLTAKNLKYRDSTGAKAAVTATQVPSGWRSKVVYDGTDYIVREVPPLASTTPAFTTSYDSGDQTITAAGALTLAHSLSAAPKLIQCLLHCTSSEGGYTTGDYTYITTNGNSDGGSASQAAGVSVLPDATNLNVRFGSAANVFAITNHTTGDRFQIDPTKWKFVVRAYY